MIAFLVLTFFVVILTGPACEGFWTRRKALRDAPGARVVYLPTGACRGDDVTSGE